MQECKEKRDDHLGWSTWDDQEDLRKELVLEGTLQRMDRISPIHKWAGKEFLVKDTGQGKEIREIEVYGEQDV